MFIVTAILGMFLDWIGIVYLVVPLFTPIAAELGFNPLWFATMMILFLQFSYLTPPFALAVFYFRSISPPEFTTGLLYRSDSIYTAYNISKHRTMVTKYDVIKIT
mgnify:CR=1 FL=1